VPHQRQAPLRRASLPWLIPSLRPSALRQKPSLPDFPGPAHHDHEADNADQRGDPAEQAEPEERAGPAGQADSGERADPAGQAGPGEQAVPGKQPGPAAGEPAVPGRPAVPVQPTAPGRPAVSFKATAPAWDIWAARRAEMPPGAPQSSAADLRELAELGDLLGELAGLVRDLGALIVGLLTAAAGTGERQPRAFAVPPQLAKLAGAHQELKAEQGALSAQFESGAGDRRDYAALRASLAALTERATRAVAVAAAVSFPGGRLPAPPEVAPDPGPSPSPGPSLASGQAAGTMPASPAQGTAPRVGPRSPSTDHQRKETRVQMQAPVAVALDAPDIDVAAHWATLVTPYVSTVKIGLELYLRYGPAVVATVRGGSGVQVFLDLKLHDIPNTVAGAARAVAKLRPEILTVHAAGGADMIKAAVQAAPDTLVAGVTLLTSIGDKDLADLGVGGSVSDAVRRMAALAVSAGARGLVCSPREVAAVRAEVGPGILLITPGIRPAGVTSDDQARIATPVEALKAGADLLVIGRPITRAPDPGSAAAAIAMSLRHAVAAR
jgi:orotidine-5'-phosphate decarboxylase